MPNNGLTHEGYYVILNHPTCGPLKLNEIFYFAVDKTQEEARAKVSEMININVDLITLERI